MSGCGTLRDQHVAGWKMGAPDLFVDVFPIKNGDIPASYVCLPEGSHIFFLGVKLGRFLGLGFWDLHGFATLLLHFAYVF